MLKAIFFAALEFIVPLAEDPSAESSEAIDAPFCFDKWLHHALDEKLHYSDTKSWRADPASSEVGATVITEVLFLVTAVLVLAVCANRLIVGSC